MTESFERKPRAAGVLPYFLAVLGMAGASLLVLLAPMLQQRGAMVIFLGVVSLVTWFGGWRPGVLAIVLAGLMSAWIVLRPTGSLAVDNWDDLLRLGVFLMAASLIAILHASRERAITERWQTEQRLSFALSCAQMGAWYCDLKTGKFWWSDGMEKLFGRPPRDFSTTYEGFIGYIHPDDQDFVKRAVTRTTEAGQEFEIEHRVVRPDGRIVWIVTRGRIIPDEHGQPRQIVGVATDITQRKLAEESNLAG